MIEDNEVTHLFIGVSVVGLFAVGEDLPEDHAVAPDVAFRGEATVLHALWRHPTYRQHPCAADLREERRVEDTERRENV